MRYAKSTADMRSISVRICFTEASLQQSSSDISHRCFSARFKSSRIEFLLRETDIHRLWMITTVVVVVKVGDLTLNADLCKTAERWAQHLACIGRLQHSDTKHGKTGEPLGENIAYKFSSLKEGYTGPLTAFDEMHAAIFVLCHECATFLLSLQASGHCWIYKEKYD